MEPSRGQGQGAPSMGPTRPATLVIAGLAAAAVAWLLISQFYRDMPALPWLPAATIAALAALEAYAAVTTKARIDRKPGREPVDPLAVARYAVLAKASSLTGAIFGGCYAGFLGWLLLERQRTLTTSALSRDTIAATAGVLAAAALIAAALWLERACRVPKRPEDKEDDLDLADQ